MGLFSKELRELDRNTVQYMIDEMQEEIDASKKVIEEQEQQLTKQGEQLEEKEQRITEQEQQLTEQTRQLKQQELENQLYGLLSSDGRLQELGRAVSDAAYRKKLLEEYRLSL